MEILVAPIMVDALMDHSADLGVALLPNEHPTWCGAHLPLRLRLRDARGPPAGAQGIVKPADLREQRVITSAADTPYGQALQRAYGREAATLKLDLEVRSSTSACWQAQAGGGVAVVDRAAVAGDTFRGLAVRPSRRASGWRSASCATATGRCRGAEGFLRSLRQRVEGRHGGVSEACR
jgi:hypothetical protein